MHRNPSVTYLPELWMELRDRDFLRELIDDSPYTRRELSTRIGWRSHGYLNKLLNGEAKTLKAEPAVRMAQLLGVRVDRLFVTRVSGDSARTVSNRRKAAA